MSCPPPLEPWTSTAGTRSELHSSVEGPWQGLAQLGLQMWLSLPPTSSVASPVDQTEGLQLLMW